MGKIIVKEEVEDKNMYKSEYFDILNSIDAPIFWRKFISTEDQIYKLIEQLKEESEEIGEDRVKENPAEYIEPPERDEDG